MRIYVTFKGENAPTTFRCDRTVSVTGEKEFQRLKLYTKDELVGIIPYENILYWEVLNESSN